jgi:hypothetical protein
VPLSHIHPARRARREVLRALSSGAKKRPVCEALTRATCSGVPAAIT